MPPKHKLRKKRNDSQHSPPPKCALSSNSDPHAENTPHDGQPKTSSKSSIESSAISSNPKLKSTPVYERTYIRLSKQIQEYELRRRRINGQTKQEQSDLVDDDTRLLTSLTSDWRLVLQNSIRLDDLRQGCLSLFNRVNNGQELSPNEVHHALLFLQYTNIHLTHHPTDPAMSLNSIIPCESPHFSSFTSALLKLLSIPNITLKTTLVAFFDKIRFNSPLEFTLSIAETGFLSQFFKTLNPHEISFSNQTMELHSHVTSLVYYVLSFFTPKNVVDRLDDQPDQSTFLQRISNITSSLFTEIKPYLKHLFGHPGCFPGHPGVICFISFLIMFHAYFETDHPESLVPEIQQMHNDIQKEMSDEFYSSLRLACPDENFECQLIDTNQVTDRGWAFVFARLLERVGKERPFSDLEFQWLITFLSQRPQSMKLVFKKDGTFGIKLEDNIFGSATFHARSLCSLFTPTQPHHAPPLLTSFNDFIRQIDEKDLVLYIFDGWLSNLFAAVPPSTLLFTPDFIHLHTVLIRVMENRLDKPRYFPPSSHHFGPQLQSALEKSYLSFLEHSKDYFVHLSLNPFALERTGSDTILQFLASLLKSNLHYQNPFISFQKTLIKAMDASALSSSSPPLIRTTELVRYLSEKETISIVDRIVAHIDRNTFLDDDSLLRIYIFIQRQLKIDSLPQLFQNLGRTTNQYFSALKAFLSIDVDSFLPRRRTNSQPQYLFWYFTPEYNPPINNLFLYCPDTSRTKSEWKEVFFETILVMMRSLKLDKRLSSSTAKAHHVNLRFVIQKSLQFASPSAAHLTPTTLERWPPPRSREKHEPTVTESVLWTDHHITIHTRCEHPVIAHLLCKHGFYMLLLDDLTVYGSSSTAMSVLTHLIRSYRERDENMTQKRWLENGVMMCLNEEGWQDAMDFVHFQKQDFGYRKYESNITAQSKVMMNFCGANLSRVYD